MARPIFPALGVNRMQASLFDSRVLALNNERLIPQQSVSSLTNVDDVESYIRQMDSAERQFLQIIDLPVKQRPAIMRDLSAMGITAGSLFPGVDGACTELKERMFPNL